MKWIHKKWMAGLFAIWFLFYGVIACLPNNAVYAADSAERLITVGGKTVTGTMKISDVKAMFGEPKIATPSYWGGSAYTFHGEDYSDYLYLETDADGNIVCYGSISEGFETDELSYGDVCDSYVRIGTEAKDYDRKLYGVIRYTSRHMDAYELYRENLGENIRSLNQHATEMWNAISFLYGYNTPTTYNETLCNINAQLAENGSDWFEYCENTSQSSYFQLCASGTVFTQSYEYPNPLTFAKDGRYYRCKDGYAPAFVYMWNGNSLRNTVGFINPDILQEWESVPYTEEEQELLAKVREYYMESLDTFRAAENYYEVEPDFSTLPLVGGKLNENVAKGAVGYLNSIRVGAGLNPLEYSEELSVAAQCKSTYIQYLSANGINLSNPHDPLQVDGISDDYYAKCQMGSGENLFMCGIISTSIIGSISNALDDSYGVGEYYSRGHRHNLLDPNWKVIGVGNTNQQGCHKMQGYAPSNVEVVAWPSKGVLPDDSGFVASGMMTCQFYNGYSGTASTTVKIRCLNSGREWTIDPANLSNSQDIRASGHLISYQDNSISFARGGVYEITFEHLKNAQNEEVSYTYRTVYETAYMGDDNEEVPGSLTLGSTSMIVGNGTTTKIKATIAPTTALNKRIYWKSADESVATVNECGEVTALSLGETDIIAMTEDGNVTASCHVKVAKDVPVDITPKKGDLDGDGKVKLKDAQLALRAALNLIRLTDEQIKVADLDENGKVNLKDAQMILRGALNLISL